MMALSMWALAACLPCVAETGGDARLAALQADAKKSFREVVTPFVESYCAGCHGQRRQKAGIDFRPVLKSPGEAAATKRWKQAVASVKAHDMPPENADKQPSEQERTRFMEAVARIKYLSEKDPGPFVIRRLTKVEYGNTLRDLLGVDPAIAAELPDEVFGEGYLNTLSPLQSEQFLAIANEVIDRVLAPEGKPPTKVQSRLFGRTPRSAANERDAAGDVARTLARMAYRRPPAESEVDVLLKVFELGRSNGLSYDGSLRLVLKAVLVSPQFLFITPAGTVPADQKIVPLDDHQLASRLSYLLWATMPDKELSGLADQGRLRDPEVLKAQARRLLADPRSRALFDGFGAQWLGLADLQTRTFDTEKFPLMTASMRAAMYDEARLMFESIVRENRSIVSFVDAEFTFLNATIAPLYGLEKVVKGPAMRRVPLTDANRGGILAMPGILAATSFPNRTSPVKRGVWVLEQVLGEHVPPPPANVPALEEQDSRLAGELTLRQRTELHVQNAVCANCHKMLDPIGFGLENFDAIGRWREKDDTGGTIDAAGAMPDGRAFTSPRELKAMIAARKDDLCRNLAHRLLSYALCRQLEGYDEVVVDQLTEKMAKDGHRMQTLITEIVTSHPFTHRRIH